MLRQFKVTITNIEVINESKQVMEPFIRLVIGGNQFIEIKNRGRNEIYMKHGEMGIVHTTDVIKFLEPT